MIHQKQTKKPLTCPNCTFLCPKTQKNKKTTKKVISDKKSTISDIILTNLVQNW